MIARLRMWYAEVRGHKGKPWNYEPSEHYMGRRSKKQMAELEKLVKELGQLTVVEALELSKRLQKEWNIDLDNIVNAPAPAEVQKEEDAPVTVVLESFPDDKKIAVLKKVREYNDMGLMEAKNFVESAPANIKEDIPKEEAETIKKAFEDLGAVIKLK